MRIGLALLCGSAVLAACSRSPVATESTSPEITTGVNPVSVAPASVVMSTAVTVQFTAMAAGAPLPWHWSWSSGDTTAVRVDSAGLVRAFKNTAGVAVCATLKSDTNKKGCAQVVVSGPAAAR